MDIYLPPLLSALVIPYEKTLTEGSFPPIHHCRLISCLHMLPQLSARLCCCPELYSVLKLPTLPVCFTCTFPSKHCSDFFFCCLRPQSFFDQQLFSISKTFSPSQTHAGIRTLFRHNVLAPELHIHQSEKHYKAAYQEAL